jgi:hypothetical protein
VAAHGRVATRATLTCHGPLAQERLGSGGGGVPGAIIRRSGGVSMNTCGPAGRLHAGRFGAHSERGGGRALVGRGYWWRCRAAVFWYDGADGARAEHHRRPVQHGRHDQHWGAGADPRVMDRVRYEIYGRATHRFPGDFSGDRASLTAAQPAHGQAAARPRHHARGVRAAPASPSPPRSTPRAPASRWRSASGAGATDRPRS